MQNKAQPHCLHPSLGENPLSLDHQIASALRLGIFVWLYVKHTLPTYSLLGSL